MSENINQVKIMLLILGLSLLFIGIFLTIQTKTEYVYTNINGFQIPTGTTEIHPYLNYGLISIAFSAVIIIFSFTAKNEEKPVKT